MKKPKTAGKSPWNFLNPKLLSTYVDTLLYTIE